MLIESKEKALIEAIQKILTVPDRYALAPDRKGAVAIQDILESLLIFETWDWINLHDIEDTAQRSPSLAVDAGMLRLVSDSSPKDFYFEAEKTPPELFLPLPIKPGKPIKLYNCLKTAILISGHRNGDFENARVKRFNLTEALPTSVQADNRIAGIFLAPDLSVNQGDIVDKKTISELLSDFYIDLMFKEMLYLDDEGYQVGACRYLHENLDNKEIENKLSKYLEDSEPEVRKNVCFGLSFPIASGKVQLNKPFATYHDRIKTFTISLKTADHVLRMLEKEKDPEALETGLYLLKIQSYKGRLSPLKRRVIKVLENISPRINSEQTRRDCEKLIDELSRLILIEKMDNPKENYQPNNIHRYNNNRTDYKAKKPPRSHPYQKLSFNILDNYYKLNINIGEKYVQ